MDVRQKVFQGGRAGAQRADARGTAEGAVRLDQRKLFGRLERLEQQIAKGNQQRGGGFVRTLKVFAFGSLLGGGLALLYAPQAGEQTRRQLLQRGNEMKEEATQAAGQAQQSVTQAKDRVQSSAMRPPSAAPATQAVWQQRQDLASGKENPA